MALPAIIAMIVGSILADKYVLDPGAKALGLDLDYNVEQAEKKKGAKAEKLAMQLKGQLAEKERLTQSLDTMDNSGSNAARIHQALMQLMDTEGSLTAGAEQMNPLGALGIPGTSPLSEQAIKNVNGPRLPLRRILGAGRNAQ